jgi:multiple sugar transport system substrate-binding protein
VPFSSDPIIMAYNKAMFAAAGIDKPATTWDGLIEQAKKLTKDGVYGMAVPYADTKQPWKFIWEMSNEQGNGFVDGKTATLDDPAVLNSYKEFYSWLDDGLVDPAAVGWTQAQSLAAFADGKAAIMPQTNPRSKATLDASSVADDYGYALMPTVAPGFKENPKGGVASPTHVGGQLDAVANYSSNQDLAWAYINMVTSPEEQLYTYSTILYQPANAEASASLAKDGKNAGVIAGIAAAEAAAPTAFTGAWADIQLAVANVVVQSIPDLANGGISDDKLKQLLSDAQRDAQAALDRAPGQ